MSGRFTIKPVRLKGYGFVYETFMVAGRLNGCRIRRQFKSRDEAIGEKHALEVEAPNVGGDIRARNTRLSAAQLAEAEVAIARLGPKSLTLAVDWFLTTYKPPVTAMAIEGAAKAFLDEKAFHIRPLFDFRFRGGAVRWSIPAPKWQQGFGRSAHTKSRSLHGRDHVCRRQFWNGSV